MARRRAAQEEAERVAREKAEYEAIAKRAKRAAEERERLKREEEERRRKEEILKQRKEKMEAFFEEQRKKMEWKEKNRKQFARNAMAEQLLEFRKRNKQLRVAKEVAEKRRVAREKAREEKKEMRLKWLNRPWSGDEQELADLRNFLLRQQMSEESRRREAERLAADEGFYPGEEGLRVLGYKFRPCSWAALYVYTTGRVAGGGVHTT